MTYHPVTQIMAVCNSLGPSANTPIPMEREDYDNEVPIIKHIAAAIGYRRDMIDKLTKKTKQK